MQCIHSTAPMLEEALTATSATSTTKSGELVEQRTASQKDYSWQVD